MHCNKIAVNTVFAHKRIMIALFGNTAVLDHKDLVGVSDRTKSVGDHNQCFAFAKFTDRLLDIALVVCVNACCCLVKNDYGSVL